MSKKFIIIISILSIFIIGFAIWSYFVSNVEQPDYKVISSEGDIEVREYQPTLVAMVKVDGSREDTIKEGFRILADYIFGNNVKSTKVSMTAPVSQQQSEKIDMTAPVSQQQSEKIDMTAPVSQQQSEKIDMTAPVMQKGADDQYAIWFTMPSQYTLETLPKPVNPAITILEIEQKRFAVIKFSGRHTQDNIAEHEKRLRTYLEENDMKSYTPAIYAFYDPPWTLPFLRRNEIMIEMR
jgi:hypothetical protein